MMIAFSSDADLVPTMAHDGDACYDLRASQRVFISPMQTVRIPTSVRLDLRRGTEAQIRPRSGMSAKGMLVHFGTVDSGYTGELLVVVTNLGNLLIDVNRGDRIAQLALRPTGDIVLSGALHSGAERGDDGFGSSGVQ
jgi:dUTP pyrophosphatase